MLNAALTALGFFLAAAGALHLLYSALCAFSWQNFLMSDYGVYTNTLWNLAHGRGFRFLVDHDYLKTHLSFSLALLAPLIRVWDDPRLLIWVQWLFLVGGSALLWRVMLRGGVALPLRAVLLALFMAHPFTQSVMISEFHFVSAYLLLFPWLLHHLLLRRAWTWLPLLIILGLREEAGLLAVPMLIHATLRERWKPGWAWVALTVFYVVAAVLWIYPLVHGESLFSVRNQEVTGGWHLWSAAELGARATATGRLVAVGLPFLTLPRKAWMPLLVLPCVAWVLSMASGFARQYSLGFHYPAAPFSLLVTAMVMGAYTVFKAPADRPGPGIMRTLSIVMLVLVVADHVFWGYIGGGGRCDKVYLRPNPRGAALMSVARQAPRRGLLLAEQSLAPMRANRADIVTWRYWRPEEQTVDAVLFDINDRGHRRERVVQWVCHGEMRCTAKAWPYVLLECTPAPQVDEQTLSLFEPGLLVVASMPGHGGANRFEPGYGVVRTWEGDGSRAPINLAHGRCVRLKPGAYVVELSLRSRRPRRNVRDTYGALSLHGFNQADALVEIEIPPVPSGEWRTVRLPFKLAAVTDIEPRITGGDAPLWLLTVVFKPDLPKQ